MAMGVMKQQKSQPRYILRNHECSLLNAVLTRFPAYLETGRTFEVVLIDW